MEFIYSVVREENGNSVEWTVEGEDQNGNKFHTGIRYHFNDRDYAEEVCKALNKEVNKRAKTQ